MTATNSRRLAAGALLVLVATAAVGCGSSDPQPQTSSPSASASSRPTIASGDETEIARVALAYTEHTLDDEAEVLIAPESRKVFEYLKAAAPPGLRSSTSSLAIGDVKVQGSSATAVITGTLCKSDADHPEQCITNDDPHSTDPTFAVNLVKVEGAWLITFPRPS